MAAQLHTIPFSELQIERGSIFKSCLYTIVWVAAAIGVHLGVFYATQAISKYKAHVPSQTTDEKPTFVVINELPKDPEPILEDARPNEYSVDTVSVEQPKDIVARVRPKKRRPFKQENQAQEITHNTKSEFVDMGVMGSVDIGATGPGGANFTVATGNSGVGGPIGKSGKVFGNASANGTLRKMPEKARVVEIVSIRNLSQKAKPLHSHNRKLKAPYPKELRESGIVGDIQAVLTVLANGTVGRVKIIRSSHDAFVSSAMNVLKQFSFRPALNKNGQPVNSKVTLTYRFTLE